MLTLLVKQQTPVIEVYEEPKVISVKVGIPTITVYDDTKPPEPFTYVDAGLYSQEGLAVDALYYNTTSWNETWNGGYA